MNKTEQDALLRIQDARTGCLVDATDTFLVALQARLKYWLADIGAEIRLRDYARSLRGVNKIEESPMTEAFDNACNCGESGPVQCDLHGPRE